MLWSDISFFGVPVMICVAVFTRLYYFPIIFSEAELAQIDDDGTAIDDGPPPFTLLLLRLESALSWLWLSMVPCDSCD